VSGTLYGKTVAAQDALAGDTYLRITDYANACANESSPKANGTDLFFGFTGATIPLGTTQVGAALDAMATVNDATCNSTGQGSNTGSVTVTRADSCGVAGTFDVTFAPDHLTGSFYAPRCARGGGDGGCF
jgi:hypothetical protein